MMLGQVDVDATESCRRVMWRRVRHRLAQSSFGLDLRLLAQRVQASKRSKCDTTDATESLQGASHTIFIGNICVH